jgi:hypothetical protein
MSRFQGSDVCQSCRRTLRLQFGLQNICCRKKSRQFLDSVRNRSLTSARNFSICTPCSRDTPSPRRLRWPRTMSDCRSKTGAQLKPVHSALKPASRAMFEWHISIVVERHGLPRQCSDCLPKPFHDPGHRRVEKLVRRVERRMVMRIAIKRRVGDHDGLILVPPE